MNSDKRYRERLGEAYNEITRRSYYKNKEKRLLAIRKRAVLRTKTDPSFRLMERCRNRVYCALKGKDKSKKTQELIGCTWIELKEYLERQFQEGMSWENYGKEGWEIDHIKPCALFDLSEQSQQKECFHYTNLQPLWGIDNRKKGNKYATHTD